ncbi:actin cortical patch SUR7/pH-response regulator pali [Ilyonectria destructans]|nr:actin cortical patch SUR7/pH-response regulator pali [Ilyonectria destructans]
MSQCLHIFPVILSLGACILSALSLFAGFQKGFIDDYAIARINTSQLGQNMIDLPGNDNSTISKGDRSDGILDTLTDKRKEITDEVMVTVEDGLNAVTSYVVDELTEAIGISEWYSLHVLDFCHGFFTPNTSNPSAGFNITGLFELSNILNAEQEIGPYNLTLLDFDWPGDIETAVEILNQVLLVLFILYALGSGLSDISLLLCLIAFCVASSREVRVLSSLATLSIVIRSVTSTIGAFKGVQAVNEMGGDVGVSALVGMKFIILTWIPAGLKFLTTIYWIMKLCSLKRENKKREWRKWKEWQELEERDRKSESKMCCTTAFVS